MLDAIIQLKDAAYSLLRKANLARLVSVEVADTAGASCGPADAVTMQLMDRYPNVDPNLINLLVADVMAFGHVASDGSDGKVLSVDFDGTLVEEAKFPAVGKPIAGAIEAMKKLYEEGWKIVIFSHRASCPGGREQIAAWCKEVGIKVSAVIPKIYSRWYIDNKAIPFENNWEAICDRLHYEVPVEQGGTRVSASAIRAGDVTLKAIAANLGFDHEVFRADISAAYAKHTPESAAVFRSKFREKYGMDVNLYDLAKAPDTTAYWLDRLAALAERVAANDIREGDAVLVVEAGPHFGNTGVVTSLSDTGAEVVLDSTPDAPVVFRTPRASLKLSIGKAATVSKPDPEQLVIAPNRYYDKGVTASNIAEWYGKTLPAVSKYCSGKLITAMYSFDGSKCIQSGPLPFSADKLNPGKLLTLDVSLPDTTTMAAVSFNPTAGYNPNMVKLAMVDLLDYLQHPDLSDIRLRFGGNNNYFMILEFSKPHKLAEVQARVDNLVKSYIQDASYMNVTTEPTAKADHLYIDSKVASIPAPYSINMETGLACLPLDMMKLDHFDPKQAVIV